MLVRMRTLRTDVRPWSEAATLGDLLLQAAASTPEADAVVFPDERLSYAELEARARALARRPDRPRRATARPRRRADGQQPGRDRLDLRDRARGRDDRPDQHPLPRGRAAVRGLRRGREGDPHQRPHRRLRRPPRAAARRAARARRSRPSRARCALDAAPELRAVVVLGDKRRPGTLAEAELPRARELRRGAGVPPLAVRACATTRCCSTRAAPPRCRAAAASPTRRSCATGRRSRRSCASAPAIACGRRARSSTSARSAR